MKALRELCGCNSASTTRLASIQTILGNDIERYGDAVKSMLRPQADQSTLLLYGCFATRKLLEACCTSILARIDPARVLILREFQMRGAMKLDERNSASIDWKSDVISTGKADWKASVPPSQFIRALLGGHLAEVMWCEALRTLPAAVAKFPTFTDSTWTSDLLDRYDVILQGARERAALRAPRRRDENARVDEQLTIDYESELAMLNSLRTAAQSCFSTLSKGVHLEFVVDPAAQFDTPTILEQIVNTIKVVTQIATVSHLMDSIALSIDLATVGRLALEVESEIVQ